MADNEIAVRHEDTDSWIAVVGPVAKLADYIARTEFTPKAMRGNAPAVAATILTGRELGMGPLTALRSLDVIEGSVQMKTKAILARIFQAGHRVEWLEGTDKACEVRIERGDGLTTAQVRWTIADAQRAELAGKAVWRRYPRAMLRNRALSECAELACPDVILGMEVGEDVGPVGASEPSRVVQVTQQANPATTTPPQAPEPAPDHWPVAVDTEPAQVAEVVPEPVEAEIVPEPADLITPAQLRKLGALIGQLEDLEGRKLDRDERRRLIGAMAGHPDPDALASAKDLTKTAASTAIDQLQQAIDTAPAEPEPET
jgi:hypothetical protein